MNDEPLLLWLAVLAYIASGSAAIVALVFRRRLERAVLAALLLAVALHGVAIALRWERVGHGPFITLFEVLSGNVWSLAAIFALAYWRLPAIRVTAAFVMPVLFLMIGWLLVSHPGEGHFPPTYRTAWLWVHVGFGKVFLGALLVAVGIAATNLARGPDERLDRLALRFLALGFVFETLMLIAGAIWAQDAWGRFWAWDPLETWAFLTWLALAATLHARSAFPVTPRASAVMVLAVFTLAFLTFFGMPFVSTAPHKGVI